VQHDSSSVLAVTTNTLHNALCIILNLFRNLRLRIAIDRSAWRQPNISKHTSYLLSKYCVCGHTLRLYIVTTSGHSNLSKAASNLCVKSGRGVFSVRLTDAGTSIAIARHSGIWCGLMTSENLTFSIEQFEISASNFTSCPTIYT